MLETRRIAMCILGEMALARHLDEQLTNEFYKDDVGSLIRILDEGLQRGLKECDKLAMVRLIEYLQAQPEDFFEYRNVGARARASHR